MATLKSWRLLRKLRCSTTRITDLVKAALASTWQPQAEVGKASVSSGINTANNRGLCRVTTPADQAL